jgi:hypothetical protein
MASSLCIHHSLVFSEKGYNNTNTYLRFAQVLDLLIVTLGTIESSKFISTTTIHNMVFLFFEHNPDYGGGEKKNPNNTPTTDYNGEHISERCVRVVPSERQASLSTPVLSASLRLALEYSVNHLLEFPEPL